MGCRNSKIPKPKITESDDAACSYPYVRGSKEAKARSQQVIFTYDKCYEKNRLRK